MKFPELNRAPLDILTLLNIRNWNLNSSGLDNSSDIFIGGRLEGLSGSEIGLDLEYISSTNNQSNRENLLLQQNGDFKFAAKPLIGTEFRAFISRQPTSGNQFCQITGAEGLVTSSGSNTILIQCGDPTLERPIFSVAGGEFTSPVLVELSSAETGTEIYFTTDGSTPNCLGNGTLYTTAINIPQPSFPGITITAVNCRGEEFSFANSNTYIVTNGILDPPESLIPISPPDYSTQQSIGLQYPTGTPAGVEIRYTLDGSTPVCSSPLYSSPILISTSTTIRAISCLNGWTSSSVAILPFTITGTMSDPVISPNGGNFNGETLVTISSTGSDSIYYRTDGTPPDCSGSPGNNLYTTGGFNLVPTNSTMTVHAIGCAAPAGSTSVVSTSFTFQVAEPVLKIASENFSLSVATLPPTTFLVDLPSLPFITCYSTSGNAECSTTNGGTATPSGGFCALGSTVVPTEGISLSSSGNLSLRSCRENYLRSNLKTINLNILDPVVNFKPRIFVTNSTQTGSVGLEQADEICNTDSNRPYKGSEVTWEVFRQGNNIGGLGGRLNNLRWVLEPNTEYFNALGQSLQTTNPSGRGFNNPLDLSNPISTLPSETWTGMNVNAVQNLILNPAANCNSWTSSTGGTLGESGLADSTGTSFANNSPITCNNLRPYYCVERHPRKRVFVTDNLYNGNLGGKSGADEKCNLITETNRPGSGTYKAMIMSADRDLTNDWVFKPNRSYYAVDRITEVLNTDSSGKIQAIPNILSGDLVYTGMNNLGEANTANCLSWTSDQNSEQGGLGRLDGFDPVNGIYQGEGACDDPRPIVCVEQ